MKTVIFGPKIFENNKERELCSFLVCFIDKLFLCIRMKMNLCENFSHKAHLTSIFSIFVILALINSQNSRDGSHFSVVNGSIHK